MNREQIVAAARQAAVANGIDPARFVALLQHESDNFAPDVLAHTRRSSTGAAGIGQFMPATAKEYGVTPGKPDIAREIAASATYMGKLKRQFDGDENLATKAYNWGQGNVRKWLAGKASLPKETKNHSAQIEKLMGSTAVAVAKAPTTPQSLAAPAASQTPAMPAQPAGAAQPAYTPRFSGTLAAMEPVQDVPVANAPDVTPVDWKERLMALAAIDDGEQAKRDTLSAMFADTPQQQQIDPVHLPSSVLSALNGIIAKV